MVPFIGFVEAAGYVLGGIVVLLSILAYWCRNWLMAYTALALGAWSVVAYIITASYKPNSVSTLYVAQCVVILALPAAVMITLTVIARRRRQEPIRHQSGIPD